MVVPLGGLDMPPGSMEAPLVVKESQSKWWWAAAVLFILNCTARFVALDIFGAFNTGAMGYIAWYLVSDNCAKMSQCCVLFFGIMCVVNGIFDLLPLLASLGGRTIETTTYQSSETGSKVYTVTIEKHEFFDHDMGDYYNFQSICMIVDPIVNLIGALLARSTYNSYTTSLFNDSEDEAARPFGRGGAGGFDGGAGGGGNAGRSLAGGHSYGGGDPGAGNSVGVSAFQGQGHRLGQP